MRIRSPGQNPAINNENVVIGKEIGFRVKQDNKKHQLEISNSKLVEKNDVSIQSVKSRTVYTRKVEASPDLVEFLRSNSIPFQAASRKGVIAVAMASRAAILFVYMIFLMELVDTLRNPGKYAILGARAPTGLLLEVPPGTGKTMLARACAATAGVALLYCSGSNFVQMFVGSGAARVRKTFASATKTCG